MRDTDKVNQLSAIIIIIDTLLLTLPLVTSVH